MQARMRHKGAIEAGMALVDLCRGSLPFTRSVRSIVAIDLHGAQLKAAAAYARPRQDLCSGERAALKPAS
jgi:hypothetical protein